MLYRQEKSHNSYRFKPYKFCRFILFLYFSTIAYYMCFIPYFVCFINHIILMEMQNSFSNLHQQKSFQACEHLISSYPSFQYSYLPHYLSFSQTKGNVDDSYVPFRIKDLKRLVYLFRPNDIFIMFPAHSSQFKV